MNEMHKADVVIAGAGPAGLMAAITAARAGARVALYERMELPALKLQASGGGRCNLTNRLAEADFIRAFGKQGRFITPALSRFSSRDLRAFFERLGVETFSRDGIHVFPCSESSRDVCQALLNECYRLRVALRPEAPVEDLLTCDGAVTGVKVAGVAVACGRVIVATGGKGYPGLGGGETGFRLLERVGHTITPLYPANVPLISADPWCAELAGVSIPRVCVSAPSGSRRPTAWTGALLFTHKGVSGPVILDCSGTVAGQLAHGNPVTLRVNFLAGHPLDIHDQLMQWRAHHGGRQLVRLLGLSLPASLSAVLCRLAGVPDDCRMANLSAPIEEQLVTRLTDCPLKITATEGFDRAMVTRGGVSLKEIDPHTLQSRLVKNLYLAGEVMDLDAPCGGFNLQWAFSSGVLAGGVRF
ncbi:MAG: NAD(P)/FAD-dependent oxidoreductase [Spartobacteria bacterium]|nr:NAD(P)/FAD-dependent oxidoreductase [Spartobacteria bacterium]